jgi:predicted kinase
MRQLVVLVGLPGSGKTSFQREHPEWATVSRSAIRHSVFRCSFDPSHEATVDRIFHAALVETVDSPVETVCVDEPNLTRVERLAYAELARLSGRQLVARVFSPEPADALFERLERNLRRLALEKPHLSVRAFPRRVFDGLAAQYEPIESTEGFAEVVREESESALVAAATTDARRSMRRQPVSRSPLPLFTS